MRLNMYFGYIMNTSSIIINVPLKSILKYHKGKGTICSRNIRLSDKI